MGRFALVVDDSRQTADTLSRMLQLLGYQVHTSYGARQVLVEFADEKLDVVLLDINMPGIDGFEVLGFFKRDPRLKNVPIIIVSSEIQQENIDRALEVGAAGFLPKPVSMEALEQVLEDLFEGG